MSCEQFCGDEPHTQTMLLRGNIIIQGTPENQSQLIAMFRDHGANTGATMDLTLAYNTIIGTPRDPGRTHNLINLRNDSVSAYAHLNNNLIVDVGDIGEAAEPESSNWGIDGASNWVTTGTEHGELTDTIEGSDPGFVDSGSLDYTLTAGSPAVGAANDALEGTPDREYYRDETVAIMWRPRASANDIGAFERGNDAEPVGPNGDPPDPVEPAPDGTTPDDPPDVGGEPTEDASSEDGGSTEDASSEDGGPTEDASSGGGSDEDGCGCDTSGTSRHAPWTLLLLLGAVGLRQSAAEN
jgi:MYXO-CTERM domain-containing protein